MIRSFAKQFILSFVLSGLVILSFLYFKKSFRFTQSQIISPLPFTSPQPSATPTLAPNQPINLASVLEYVGTPAEQNVKIDPQTEIVLVATGDIIPARSVNNKVTNLNDFTYPYLNTVNLLREADITFVNLESPLIPNCPATVEGMVFCGNQNNVLGLTYAGIDIVSIANNHAGNHGFEGIQQTIYLLHTHVVLTTGSGSAAVKVVKGLRFGFLGYNDIGTPEKGIAWADIPTIQKQVAELKQQVDFVIVTYHWGTEYKHNPDQRQIDLAHATIDAGADRIIGNHPHWVQGLEIYKNKFITYAHGNFVFDQMWSRETTEGVVGMYIFNANGLKDVHFYPIVIENYSQPRFATVVEAKKILNDMRIATKY